MYENYKQFLFFRKFGQRSAKESFCTRAIQEGNHSTGNVVANLSGNEEQ